VIVVAVMTVAVTMIAVMMIAVMIVAVMSAAVMFCCSDDYLKADASCGSTPHNQRKG
jgi:hypothetical protein